MALRCLSRPVCERMLSLRGGRAGGHPALGGAVGAVLVGRVSAPFCVGQCVASLARNWTASAAGSDGVIPPVPSAGHPSQSATSMFFGRLKLNQWRA